MLEQRKKSYQQKKTIMSFAQKNTRVADTIWTVEKYDE